MANASISCDVISAESAGRWTVQVYVQLGHLFAVKGVYHRQQLSDTFRFDVVAQRGRAMC